MTPAMDDTARRHAVTSMGKKIAYAMDVRGFERADLAAALGCHEQRVARIIKGSSEATSAELWWLAKLFDCDIKALLPQ